MIISTKITTLYKLKPNCPLTKSLEVELFWELIIDLFHRVGVKKCWINKRPERLEPKQNRTRVNQIQGEYVKCFLICEK